MNTLGSHTRFSATAHRTALLCSGVLVGAALLSGIAGAQTRSTYESHDHAGHSHSAPSPMYSSKSKPTRPIGPGDLSGRRMLELDTFEPQTNGVGLLEPAAPRSADDPLHWRLNLDLDFSSVASGPLWIERVEWSYPVAGAPAPKSIKGHELLVDTKSPAKKRHLFNGGWNVFGATAIQWDELGGYYHDVIFRNEGSNGRRYIGVGTQFQPGGAWLLARLNSDGSHIRSASYFDDADAAVARALVDYGSGVAVAGWVKNNGVRQLAIGEFDAVDLDPNASFGIDGLRQYSVPGADIKDVVGIARTLGDYLILVAVERNGIKEMALLRTDGNGEPREWFGDDGWLRIAFPFNVDLQPAAVSARSGVIHIAGSVGSTCSNSNTVQGGNCQMVVLKLNNDGSYDMDYGSAGAWRLIQFNGATHQGATALAVDNSGAAWVGGWAKTSNSNKDRYWAIAKLLPSGSPDGNWAGNGEIDELCAEPPCGTGQRMFQINNRAGVLRDLSLAAGGRIAAAGWVTGNDGKPDFTLARFDAAGQPEWAKTAFSHYNEHTGWAIAHAVVVDDLDRAVLVGSSNQNINDGSGGDQFASARFLADGSLDSRLLLQPGDSRELKLPESRELLVAAGQIQVRVHFRGMATTQDFVIPLQPHQNGLEKFGGYQFPLDGLQANEYWSTGQHHVLHSNHRQSRSQRFAYDFGAAYIDPNANNGAGDFRSTHLDDEGNALPNDANENYLIWGKDVRAAATGRVLVCYRGLADNIAPGAENKNQTVIDTAGGGNMFWIEHTNGEVALYAHLQNGSVPASLCPSNGPQAGNIWVLKGTKLGEVGNSGNSTGPHLHFHVQRGLDSYSEAIDNTFNADNEGLPSLFGDAEVLRKADLKNGKTDFGNTWMQAVPYDVYIRN